MFGMWESIYGFLTRQIGLRGDSADPNGSLHAKVREFKENVNSKIETVQKPRGAIPAGNFSSSVSGTWHTALDISGRGCLNFLMFTASSGTTFSNISLTIDGVQFAGGGLNQGKTVYLDQTGSLIETQSTCRHPFKESLKIEILPSSGSAASVFWQYELE